MGFSGLTNHGVYWTSWLKSGQVKLGEVDMSAGLKANQLKEYTTNKSADWPQYRLLGYSGYANATDKTFN